MDAVPAPHFPASPEAVTMVLVQGCHRAPGVLTGLFHSHIEPHETPQQYYQRIFICSLRFPALATLGVPPPDVFAIEEAVRHTLLRCSLPQALDFLSTSSGNLRCQSRPWLSHHSSLPSSRLLPYLSTSCFTRGRRGSSFSLLDYSPYLSQHGRHQSQV